MYISICIGVVITIGFLNFWPKDKIIKLKDDSDLKSDGTKVVSDE